MPSSQEGQPAYLETLKGTPEFGSVPVFELPVITPENLQEERLNLGLEKTRQRLDAFIGRAVDQELKDNPHANDLKAPAVRAEIYNAIGLEREDRLIDPDKALGGLLGLASEAISSRVLATREGDSCAEARTILRQNLEGQLNHRGMAAARSAIRILAELAQGRDIARQEWKTAGEVEQATSRGQERVQTLNKVFGNYTERCELAVVECQQQLILEKEREKQIPIIGALEQGKKTLVKEQVETLLKGEGEPAGWQDRVVSALTTLVNRKDKNYTPAEIGQALGLVFVSCSAKEQPLMEQAITRLFGDANIAYNRRTGLASGDVMLVDLMSEKEALVSGEHQIEFPVAEDVLRKRVGKLLEDQQLRLPSGWLHNLGKYPSGLLYPSRLLERAVANVIGRIDKTDINLSEGDVVQKTAAAEQTFTVALQVKEILGQAFSKRLTVEGDKAAVYLGRIDKAVGAKKEQIDLRQKVVEGSRVVEQAVDGLLSQWL